MLQLGIIEAANYPSEAKLSQNRSALDIFYLFIDCNN